MYSNFRGKSERCSSIYWWPEVDDSGKPEVEISYTFPLKVLSISKESVLKVSYSILHLKVLTNEKRGR
jgi:hypothetical protein